MKKFMLLLTVVSIIFSGIIMSKNQKDGGQLMVEAFNQTTFQAVQSNINTYAILKEPLQNFESMEDYLKIIDEKIGADDSTEIIKDESDEVKSLKKMYMSKSAKITIALETINDSTYLVTDVILYNYCENIIPIKEQLDELFNDLSLKAKTNITMTGSYDGNMSYDDKKLTAFDIMKKINAVAQEDYVTDKIYSVVGYTKKINEYIYSDKQKININLALRYNEYENKTYLYLATPVITVEY